MFFRKKTLLLLSLHKRWQIYQLLNAFSIQRIGKNLYMFTRECQGVKAGHALCKKKRKI